MGSEEMRRVFMLGVQPATVGRAIRPSPDKVKSGVRLTSTATSGRFSGSATDASGDAVPRSAASSTTIWSACGVTGVAGGCGDRLPSPSRFSRDVVLPSSVGSVEERFALRSSL